MKNGPVTVGFIPDRNRTWAKRYFKTEKPTMDQYEFAYMRGAEVTKKVIAGCREACVQVVSLWGLSDDNIVKRPIPEREVLYSVFHQYLSDLESNYLHKPENSDVRFVHMGRRDRLEDEAPQVMELIDSLTNETADRTGMVVAMAADYGGREESKRAHRLWSDAGSPGSPEDGWQQYLDLPRQGIPYRPFDLIIRTGQEVEKAIRTNEFLWSYAQETRVIPHACYLPDFTQEMLMDDFATFATEHQNRGA